MAKNNNNQIIIGVVIIAIIFLYGGQQGWFKGTFQAQFSQYPQAQWGVTPIYIDQTPKSPDCTFRFDKSTAYVGEDVTGTIWDGSLKRCVVAYDYENTGWRIYNVENLDIDGFMSATSNTDVPGTYVWTALCGYFEGENFIAECRTNDATIEILPLPEEPPEEEPPGVGDSVGSGTGSSGGANFGDDITTSPITIPWTTGGPFILGVKITRTWAYVNPDDTQCQSPEQYPVEWTLYDSNGMAWQKYDYTPVNSAYDEVCPVTYHPDAPWSFVVSSGISCPITYSWNLQPFICEEA